jgi:hypothetical protein
MVIPAGIAISYDGFIGWLLRRIYQLLNADFRLARSFFQENNLNGNGIHLYRTPLELSSATLENTLEP